MSLNALPSPLNTMSTFGPLAIHAAPYLKLTLPDKFYNVPADAPALFSTNNGTRAKRQLYLPLSATIVRSDFDQEVKRMAAILRQELPHVAGLIRNPTSWTDLYYFFDAIDLWVEGAVFLYFVISHIAKDNVMHHRMQQDAMIFQYAGKWVTDNADRLAKLSAETDFLTLFGPAQRADIRGFRFHDLEAMKEAIRFHHARLREKYNTVIPRAQCINTPHQPASHSAHAIQKCVGPVTKPAQTVVTQPLPLPTQLSQNIGPSKLS